MSTFVILIVFFIPLLQGAAAIKIENDGSYLQVDEVFCIAVCVRCAVQRSLVEGNLNGCLVRNCVQL